MLFFFDTETRRILALDSRWVIAGDDTDPVGAWDLADEGGRLDEAGLEAIGEGIEEILSLLPAAEFN